MASTEAPFPPSSTAPESEKKDFEMEPDDSSLPSDDHVHTLESGTDHAPKLDSDPPAQQEKKHEYITGFKLFNVLAAVTFVNFLMLLDGSIIVTAIPRITDQFHALGDVGWYGAAYQLGSAVFQPLTGKIYMKFKPKWTFLSFFGIFEIGSLVCAVATSSKMLIAGRVVAGIGASGTLSGAMIIIAECVPMERRPTIIGIVMGIAQIGLVSGPLFGGLFTQLATWRWCFYVNLPCGGLIAIMLIVVRIPQQFPRPSPMSVVSSLPKHLDLLGFGLFAPAATMLLLALQFGGNEFAWSSAQIIGLFCGSGAMFIVFLVWDYYRGDMALIPFSMVRIRTVWASCMVFLFFSGQMYTASYWIPIYFQGVKGVTPILSGVYILPMIIAHIISAVSSGPILGKVGYWIPISLFSAVLIQISGGLMSTWSAGTSKGKWIGYQILLGVGRGLGLQMPIIAIQNAVAPAQIPLAMSLVWFSQSFGAALFLSFAETIFSNSFATLLPQDAPNVNPQTVISTGATGFRAVVSKADLGGVLKAYSKSIDRNFYLIVGMGFGCFLFAWGMGWKDLRKKKVVSKA